MRFYDECRDCAVRMTATIGELLEAAPEVTAQVIDRLKHFLEDSPELVPPQMVPFVYQWYTELLPGIPLPLDPYRTMKYHSNERVAPLMGNLQRIVDTSPEGPLEGALRVAAAGNIIDFGAHSYDSIDIEQEIDGIHKLQFRIFDYENFADDLACATSALYIADNAGEVYFDKILLRLMKDFTPDMEIVYAVRSRPVLNDATLEDAMHAGIQEFARVIKSGSTCPGTVLDECTPEFLDYFDSSDMIIAKGQGNLETLLDKVPGMPLYHILRIKCPCVAKELGQPVGSLILWDVREKPGIEMETRSYEGNGDFGEQEALALLKKYGISDERIAHSKGVAEFARDIATRIVKRHGRVLNPHKIYLGALLHDIGRGLPGDHERNSEKILRREGHPDLANIVMHGTYYETTILRGQEDPTARPQRLDNVIVAYADARYRLKPVTLAERFADVERRRFADQEKMRAMEMARERFLDHEAWINELLQ